jgi:hypothetical protein
MQPDEVLFIRVHDSANDGPRPTVVLLTPPSTTRCLPTRRRGKASRCARWYSFRRLPDSVLFTGRLVPSAFGARRRTSLQGVKPHRTAGYHLVPRLEGQRPEPLADHLRRSREEAVLTDYKSPT